jgi:catechol 2,3-dioxygenase-like lactoylglutathione lyase family enzyme
MIQAQVKPNRAPMVRLSFSHFGIYVRDLPKMLDFYTRVLGFTVTDRGIHQGREIVFTSWDPTEHHQVILVAGREGSLDINPINQLSFRVASLEDLQAVWQTVAAETEISDGRPVNHGNAWSYYFRDPEGNRIEIYCPTDWHVPQPCAEPLDLSLAAAEIRRRTEAFCRGLPGFTPMVEHQREMAGKMGMGLAPVP